MLSEINGSITITFSPSVIFFCFICSSSVAFAVIYVVYFPQLLIITTWSYVWSVRLTIASLCVEEASNDTTNAPFYVSAHRVWGRKFEESTIMIPVISDWGFRFCRAAHAKKVCVELLSQYSPQVICCVSIWVLLFLHFLFWVHKYAHIDGKPECTVNTQLSYSKLPQIWVWNTGLSNLWTWQTTCAFLSTTILLLDWNHQYLCLVSL